MAPPQRARSSLTGSLRLHVLLAGLLVALPPVLILALAIQRQTTRAFDEMSAARLDQGQRRLVAFTEQQSRKAQPRAHTVAEMLATTDVAALALHPSPQDPPLLVVTDADGKVLYSSQWAMGVGLRDMGRPLARQIWAETVAHEYGFRERLAIVATQLGTATGRAVAVRAGYLLDDEALGELSSAMGMPIAFRDATSNRWLAVSEPGFHDWAPLPESTDTGIGTLSGKSYRWRATPMGSGLVAVVALPLSEYGSLTSSLRRLTLWATAAALLLTLVVSVLLASRITRPVRELVRATQAQATIERAQPVPVSGARELRELAQSFNELTASLHESRLRLIQAERVAAWREMARRLAHELKNPLFPIQVSVETLQRSFDTHGATHADFAELFKASSATILDELRILRGIIDEFSRFARLPRPCLAPTDLHAVVRHVIDLYHAQAAGIDIVADLDSGPLMLLGDADLLTRALGNLLANAIDAMPEGGRVVMRTRPQPETIRLEITDTGPGLDDEQRTRLFTPYFTTKPGGTGLGLAIVQSIVTDHHGRVEVESAAGQGTTFRLVLPRLNA
jgi:two-component system, NtrC family, nitrogen regulation sensor histidine kinase NtrY